MKKVYMMPSTKWVEAQTEDMIASSLQMITGTGEEYEADKDGEVLSRQGIDLWDEE